MKKWGRMKLVPVVICIVLLQSVAAFCKAPPEQFPPARFTLPAPDSAQDQKYLGLDAPKPFKIGAIQAKLVVVEFMSASCPYCLANATVMNVVYKMIQTDPGLADVKVISIATSDGKAQVQAYRKRFKTPFPILLDGDATVSASMGGVPTPTTMIISTDDSRVLFSHTGVIQDPERFVKQLKNLRQKRSTGNDSR